MYKETTYYSLVTTVKVSFVVIVIDGDVQDTTMTSPMLFFYLHVCWESCICMSMHVLMRMSLVKHECKFRSSLFIGH